jgi:hypothetical protein
MPNPATPTTAPAAPAAAPAVVAALLDRPPPRPDREVLAGLRAQVRALPGIPAGPALAQALAGINVWWLDRVDLLAVLAARARQANHEQGRCWPRWR